MCGHPRDGKNLCYHARPRSQQLSQHSFPGGILIMHYLSFNEIKSGRVIKAKQVKTLKGRENPLAASAEDKTASAQ